MTRRRRSTQLLLTPQLLLYQLLIRPHLRRRQSRLRLTMRHHHSLDTLSYHYPRSIYHHYHYHQPLTWISSTTCLVPIRRWAFKLLWIRLRSEGLHLLPFYYHYQTPINTLPTTQTDWHIIKGHPLLTTLTNRREDQGTEVTLPPRKRLGIALSLRYKIRERSSVAAARPAGGHRVAYGFVGTMDREIRCDLERDVGYGITDSWDEIVEAMQGTPLVTDMAKFSQRMTKFETRVRQDTDEIYTRLDDEQTGQ
ncbi:hypothetical protein Tco_0694815 [Tanacetum coccineum]